MRNDNDLLLQHDFISTFDAIVLSPGPQTPLEAGYLMQVIEHNYLSLPMLGVCLGHQALGLHFGSQLVKSGKPCHGKVDAITQSGSHPLFAGVPSSFTVTRYHSLILQGILPPLHTLAISSQNEVMALAHNTLPLYGIQFHPESCLTPDGLTIIKNYIRLIQQRSFLS